MPAGAGFVGDLDDTGLTTPEATNLARYLTDFANAGAQACAVEASSIGIEEGRLDGTRVDVAVFTNLTRDHLDYHGSMESYAEAKKRLFAWPHLRLAVVNLDDPFGVERLPEAARAQLAALMAGRDWLWIDGNHEAGSSAILGGRCWADPELNTPESIADGRVYFDFDFTAPYPAEHIVFRSHLVDDYLEEIL